MKFTKKKLKTTLQINTVKKKNRYEMSYQDS